MSGSLKDTLNNSPQTDTDGNVLNLIFGNPNCISDPVTKFVWYFGLAILATIIFAILAYQPVVGYMDSYTRSSGTTFAIRVVLFFLLILILDALFTQWRLQQPICGNTTA